MVRRSRLLVDRRSGDVERRPRDGRCGEGRSTLLSPARGSTAVCWRVPSAPAAATNTLRSSAAANLRGSSLMPPQHRGTNPHLDDAPAHPGLMSSHCDTTVVVAGDVAPSEQERCLRAVGTLVPAMTDRREVRGWRLRCCRTRNHPAGRLPWRPAVPCPACVARVFATRCASVSFRAAASARATRAKTSRVPNGRG